MDTYLNKAFAPLEKQMNRIEVEVIMFIVLMHYLRQLSVVDSFLPEHRAYLDRHYAAGDFLVSGAQVPRTGGVILAREMAREKLETILAEDPFLQEGIASYQIIAFTPAKCAPGMQGIFPPAR